MSEAVAVEFATIGSIRKGQGLCTIVINTYVDRRLENPLYSTALYRVPELVPNSQKNGNGANTTYVVCDSKLRMDEPRYLMSLQDALYYSGFVGSLESRNA